MAQVNMDGNGRSQSALWNTEQEVVDILNSGNGYGGQGMLAPSSLRSSLQDVIPTDPQYNPSSRQLSSVSSGQGIPTPTSYRESPKVSAGYDDKPSSGVYIPEMRLPAQRSKPQREYDDSGSCGIKTRKEVLYALFIVYCPIVVLLLVSFGMPYWHSSDDHHFGLWQDCRDGECKSMVGRDEIRSWLPGSQALMCITVLSCLGSVVFLLLWICMHVKGSEITGIAKFFPLLAGITAIVAGAFGIIGAIVWGVNSDQLISFYSGIPNGWAFWLNVVACIAFVPIGATFILLAILVLRS